LSHLKYDLKNLFKYGRKILKSDIEAEVIIRNSLNLKREEFYLNLNKEIDKEKFKEIFKKFCMRKKGAPLSYITHKKYFLDLELEVFDDVFIPRFETEEIVHHIIKNYKKVENSIDICAGTGAIGISLLYYNFTKYCTFVDKSTKAIENIKFNLSKFNLNAKVIQSDMFNSLSEKFDLIISNPPYIKKIDYEKLPSDVRMEPYDSLIGGEDGLFFIKILISESPKFLNDNGFIVIEMEKNQLEEISGIFKKLKLKEIITTSSDNIIGVVLEKL
jgi:HemK family putative methylases